MKKFFLIAGLIAALALVALATSAAKPANFAGTWALDKAKSTGLSRGMQNAESVTWVITQDEKQISIETKIVAGQPPPGGGPGSGGGTGGGGMGGGGQRGGGGMAGPQTYNLDGKEVSTEANGGTSAMKATWSADGQGLELSRVISGNFNGNEFKSTTIDKLTVNGDGKVLTANRHSEGTRGTTDSVMIFNKQ